MHIIILYLAVAFIYATVAADFWRMSKTINTPQNQHLHAVMIALGLLLHGWLLFDSIFTTAYPLTSGFNFGFYNALSAIFWLTVLIYWLSDLNHELHSLQAFVLPPAAVFALLPAFTSQDHYIVVSNNAGGALFLAHISIAILAYSLFTFAALHALLMKVAERSLHNKTTLVKLPSFPPIMVMETLLFRIISLGFILLTITLVSGILFSEQIFAKPMQFNHKTIFSIASWLIYAGLLFGRYKYGWRGLIAIRWTLGGFILLLLAYVGSKFVLEILLQR